MVTGSVRSQQPHPGKRPTGLLKNECQKIETMSTPKKNQEAEIPDEAESLDDPTVSRIITTTPQRNRLPHSSTSPGLGERPSPFRTPTEKSQRSLSTMESLGLSPQDSVFWVRTPPSEALKKLERMSNGRSHEEEIASIVGRLYETSSAGTALRTMARGPKDRIKDMLNTLRGSSTALQNLEDELDDPDRPEPASPTKELVDRHRNISAYQQRIARHHSAQELGSTSRRRGRIIKATRPPNSSLSAQLTSPSKCREDVIKMIEQINSNMVRPLKPNHPDRPKAEDSIPSTPKNDHCSDTQTSPGEFDQFFTDLQMDVNDFEELTQLELTSTSMSSTMSTDASVSSTSSSTESCANKSLSFVRLGFSELDMENYSNEPPSGSRETRILSPASPRSTSGTTEPLSDDFGDIGDLGDDFEIEDNVSVNVASIQAQVDSAKYRRYKVNEVREGVLDSRCRGQSKVLIAHDAKDSKAANIFLCDSWIVSRVAPGDIVHVIGAVIYDSEPLDLVLSDTQGFLIVKPDSLVPTSALAESFACIRKPIIDIRARKTDESTVPLIHGTMLHELFQHSLKVNDFSTSSMESTVDRIIKMHLNDLCLVNESLEIARERVTQLIPSCQDWARRYLNPTPSLQGKMDETIGQTINGESTLLCVNKILDIEENIWSPMFGLKGKIDASIQIVLKTTKKNAGPDAECSRTLTVPFELKTGKKSNVISHRAQTMLYTLLMTDRYDVDVRLGLLFYLKSGEFVLVPAPRDEIRTIIMQRNEIAVYEEDKLALPPMAKSAQKCGRCFSFSSCTVLHKLMENGTPESSGLGIMFERVTDHLNETHAEFFRKWNRLLSLEQGDVSKFQSQIWSMLSIDRQSAGNCFSNLILMQERDGLSPSSASCDDMEVLTSGRFARHRYRFKIGTSPSSQSQKTLSQTLRGGHSLLSSNISIGDPIVVSSEGQHYALAIGHVIDMTLSEVTVGLDRPLLGPPIRLDDYDRETNQSYRGQVDITMSPAPTVSSDYYSHLEKNKITFRIDKDEMTAGISRTRNNLVQLFRADVNEGDAKRRRLVVDLDKPVFEPIRKFEHQDPHLNDDQRQAVEAVLSAKDYALILGMPGTGKTTTIAHIIQTLVVQGKSVLLTSYTHSAVDNVLLKLSQDINIVRLGNKDKVHRDIQCLVPDFSHPPVNTVEAIHNFYGRCQVVGTTCLGIGDPLFTEKRFDYCIVDEASQITLPACLGPIRYADVFVLVGDHNQLPPLVKNPEAKKDGFDLSLFKLLSDQHPEAVTSLTQQYRMNKDIMLLSNTLVYENRLKCATDQVASKALDIPAMENFRRYCHMGGSQSTLQGDGGGFASPVLCRGHSLEQSCWLEQVLDPMRSVVFIDTDDLPAHEVQVGSSTQNPTEALLVLQLTEALISSGISEQNIGVISVLRAQLKVLSRFLRARPLLDIHTVDRYQGKDKDCVIVSLVRSNTERHVGELLKDWRRINVAFTRAKKKLVVFGSRLTLQGSPVFKQFLQLMEKQEWILKLEPQSQHQHPHLLNSFISAKTTDAEGKDESNARRAAAKVADRGTKPSFEDDDKENRNQDTNIYEADLKIDKSSDTKTVAGALDRQDNDSGGSVRRKEPRVLGVRPEVVLRQMPIIKNIIDGL
ncbi:Tripartite DNA replication factor [Mortierella sp. AD094]|nr:Tripartite DNA replication factor [Mortierella sp. AD094]